MTYRTNYIGQVSRKGQCYVDQGWWCAKNTVERYNTVSFMVKGVCFDNPRQKFNADVLQYQSISERLRKYSITNKNHLHDGTML